MTQFNHTPLPTAGPLDAARFNTIFGALDAAIKKNNYAATTAPTVNDDTLDGYTVGSRWINVAAQKVYVALNVSAGAAVWGELTTPSTFGDITTGDIVADDITADTIASGNHAITTTTANGGFSLTSTAASSGSVGPQVGIFTNDGASVDSGHRIGQIAFGGRGGGSVVQGPLIVGTTTELWSATARGSRLNFYTVPNTLTVAQLAMFIEQNGIVVTQFELEVNGALNHDGTTVGFYGVVPVVRPAAYTQTYATATRTQANPTTDSSSLTYVGSADTIVENVGASFNQGLLNDNFADLAARINSLYVDMLNVKQLVNALIDDHQALGLAQ